MPRIRQLPPALVAKIAAGEVIERPASVVKELLENSVDAGSTRISVETEAGGVELIRVVDDGCGIVADDLPLAFESHATSKLDDAEDLFRLATLGFRGEALASVGGVSHVTLQSRPRDAVSGAEVACQGGAVSPVKPWNGSPGTRVEVRHLFYNVPVRRKFLKSTATEAGHVCETFTRLALANDGLQLSLRHNNKQVYDVPAAATRLDRIGLFFGSDLANQLYSIESAPEGSPLRLHGYIGDPACDRGTAKMQYLFVNGRCVRDRSLGHAVQEAYRGLLMTGRYAVAFLFIDVPPDLVDVNVHPTKSEVRFRDPNAMHHLVFTTIRSRLQRLDLSGRMTTPSTLKPPRVDADGTPFTLVGGPAPAARLPFPSDPAEPVDEPEPPTAAVPVAAADTPGDRIDTPAADSPRPQPTSAGQLELLVPPESFKAIQLYDAYLVLETPEGMLVIDQHALHEKILFEKYRDRLREGPLETQRLLLPEPVDLAADEAARTLEHAEALAGLGFQVEEFGGGTVLLTGYPAVLGRRSPAAVFKAVVDHLTAKDRLPTRDVLLNELLSLMACHSAIRSGDRLSPEEMAELVAQRHLAQDPHHCPHGRPTSLLFSRHDLERQFRRV